MTMSAYLNIKFSIHQYFISLENNLEFRFFFYSSRIPKYIYNGCREITIKHDLSNFELKTKL